MPSPSDKPGFADAHAAAAEAHIRPDDLASHIAPAAFYATRRTNELLQELITAIRQRPKAAPATAPTSPPGRQGSSVMTRALQSRRQPPQRPQ